MHIGQDPPRCLACLWFSSPCISPNKAHRTARTSVSGLILALLKGKHKKKAGIGTITAGLLLQIDRARGILPSCKSSHPNSSKQTYHFHLKLHYPLLSSHLGKATNSHICIQYSSSFSAYWANIPNAKAVIQPLNQANLPSTSPARSPLPPLYLPNVEKQASKQLCTFYIICLSLHWR